jgi:hypothetical protein
MKTASLGLLEVQVGSTVSDNPCSKLHHELATNVWCARAGTSADVEALVRRTKYKFWKDGGWWCVVFQRNIIKIFEKNSSHHK